MPSITIAIASNVVSGRGDSGGDDDSGIFTEDIFVVGGGVLLVFMSLMLGLILGRRRAPAQGDEWGRQVSPESDVAQTKGLDEGKLGPKLPEDEVMGTGSGRYKYTTPSPRTKFPYLRRIEPEGEDKLCGGRRRAGGRAADQRPRDRPQMEPRPRCPLADWVPPPLLLTDADRDSGQGRVQNQGPLELKRTIPQIWTKKNPNQGREKIRCSDILDNIISLRTPSRPFSDSPPWGRLLGGLLHTRRSSS